ncbi:hypothetical protein [Paenibacillus gallinarum]|uniref:Uncharacterized protein n=1 Tax=Paenibacillus gallinarum TaxID=2762232 RepID=A0ABR8T439_9BACL|nr:hypothetical protein [Paenibacillus gallinarum]MBD7970354.1 hypothetical protein [Paenibacillus gallinarum]
MKNVLVYKKGEDYSNIDILKNFTHIRAFHGCRTSDLDSYYTHGIKPLTKERSYEQLQYILKIKPFITEDQISTKLNEIWTEPKRVWFTITKEELLYRSGHYLLYGSELLNAVLSQFYLRDELKKNGIPTIFVCDVPLYDIGKDFLNSIIENLDKRKSLDQSAFMILGKLSAENIISHEHPDYKKIYDPY